MSREPFFETDALNVDLLLTVLAWWFIRHGKSLKSINWDSLNLRAVVKMHVINIYANRKSSQRHEDRSCVDRIQYTCVFVWFSLIFNTSSCWKTKYLSFFFFCLSLKRSISLQRNLLGLVKHLCFLGVPFINCQRMGFFTNQHVFLVHART